MDRTGPSTDVVALLRQARKAALDEIGREVLRESNERVPVDTGELRDSGAYRVIHDHVYIGYADGKATPVHEDMTSSFNNGRQAKFLETALADARARVLRIAAEKMRLR